MRGSCSQKERRLIIDAYTNGACTSEIARLFQKPRSTIISIIKKYLETVETDAAKRGGIPTPKLTDEMKNQIREWIDENCLITIARLNFKIMEAYNISVLAYTIHRTVVGFPYTLKRVHLEPFRRNGQAAIEARKAYPQRFIELLASVSERIIYFIDEAGFNVSMRCSRGHSLRGTRAIK
ncbi:hypothetical protein ENBRE01_1741 [Enteropsectra breve]|nr:hypothetical protein ENBRE01_1741 [Enteropsectra breve]